MRTLFEAFPVIVFRFGPDGELQEHVGGALDDWGLSRNEVVGRNVLGLFGDDLEIHRVLTEALSGKPVRAHGSFGDRYFNVQFEPDFHGDQFMGVVGTAFDVTDLMRAQQELERSEERYRLLIESASEGIVVLDPDYTIEFVNDAACEIFGYAFEELIGKSAFDFADADTFVELAASQLRPATRGSERFEMRYRHRDGHFVPTLVSTRPRRDLSGTLTGTVAMMSDISERVANEELQRNLQDALVYAETNEQRRLARALHDGPIQQLAAANLQLGAVRRNNVDRALADDLVAVEATLSETLRSLRLMMFDLEPANPDDIIGTIRSCAALLFSSVPVIVSIRGELPSLDPTVANSLYRIAREALTNARKHARANRVTVRLVFRDGGIAMSVRDDGVGKAATDPHGYGIRSMRDRAAELGGVATVESPDGVGTVVYAWLPPEPRARLEVDPADPNCCK